MKNLKIKNLILAAALAVGLGVTGISATAEAAEIALLEDDCNHSEDKWIYNETLISYDTQDNNRFTHTKYSRDVHYCKCGHIIVDDEVVEEEPHELVNRTANIWECVHCDYWE